LAGNKLVFKEEEMRLSKQLFFLFFILLFTASVIAQEIPESILTILRNKPEDCLIGIGMARAASKWESLSLAMTRARVQIARAISSEINSKISDVLANIDSPVAAVGAFQERTVEVLSIAHLKGSRIIDLTKASDGAWWCVINLPMNLVTVIPQQIDFSDIFLYDLSRVSSINNPRVVSDINTWINHLFQRQSEDMVYGYGVAKLESDMASFHLAKERAINSIAHTLHAEISSTVNYQSSSSEIDPDSFTELFIENISAKSEYENTDLPLGLVDFVKTEDGSLWVAVACKVISETSASLQRAAAARLTVPAFVDFDVEARMDEYLRAAREAYAEQKMNELLEQAHEDWFR
jgi:hypothetical protein